MRKLIPAFALCLIFTGCARFLPWNRPVNSALPDRGLVLHYTFEEQDAEKAVDRSGLENHGVIHGQPVIVPGPGGRALRFDGEKDYIQVPRSPSLEPDALTAAAWVRINRFHPNFGLLVQKRNRSFHNNEDYNLQIWNNGVIRMVVANGRQSRLDAANRIGTGVWHHVAMVFEEPEMRLYLDGRFAGSKRHPLPLDHNPESDLLICAAGHAQYPLDLFLNCDLDDLQIYSQALGDDDIAELVRRHVRHAPEPAAAPGPVYSIVTAPDENAPIRPQTPDNLLDPP